MSMGSGSNPESQAGRQSDGYGGWCLDLRYVQCELDPIPTSLLKDCASVLVHVITKIINLSLSSGNFPIVFKHSLVTPLLKKVNLDEENPSNYRPTSDLSFLSKLTERIVLVRLNDYLSSNSLLNPHQSGFTKHHYTETLLVSLSVAVLHRG